MKENQEKREYWQRHIDILKSSGLTRRVYCEQNEIKLSTLDYWCQKLSSSAKKEGTDKSSWIPLQIDEDDTSSGIDLRIGRIMVAVKPGFDPVLLTEVLRTIGALC